jgi:hypothetical protein
MLLLQLPGDCWSLPPPPKRMEVLGPTGAVESTFDYYDYGTPITIDLPACT